MTLKALDKSYENFNVGDIVVHSGYGAPYGVKIVKKVFLDTTGEYHFIVTEGDVSGNKWVDAKSGGQHLLSIHTVKQLRSYSHKWTPGETFNVGDILKDQDGTMYLYASATDVWNLSKGTRTTQAKWEATGTTYGGRVFKRQTTASGDPFTKVVKMENIWSSRW
ncbi:hypothetical protein SEA_DENNEBES_87 [Streptomyces phage Dennebes]|jgi:hypothetical protein|nr:hypothetical protein SEA_DENNEBES_87 [Streptomyces phage Dennebes]